MKNYFLNKTISDENKNFIFLLYSFYLIIVLLLSFFFVIAFIDNFGFKSAIQKKLVFENYDIIVHNIYYSHGPLIENIIENNNYFTYFNNIKFYFQKTLAIPILIGSLIKISPNIFFVVLVKNIIFFSFYFFVCLYFSIEKKITLLNFVILLFLPIIIPYNLVVSFNIVYEDCLIALLLPCLYLSLIAKIKYKYYIISLIVFLLYFVKTSMFIIVFLIPIIIIIIEKSEKKKFLPLFFSISAILIWGSHGLNKTGKFPFGGSGSSFNSYVLSYSLNENFHKYYPLKSTDLIPTKEYPAYINNEWDFFDYYNDQNLKYLKENKLRFIKDVVIKLKFIFFNIRRDGALSDDKGEFDNHIRLSLIINKIFFNFAIIVLIYNLVRMIKKKKFIGNEHNIYFLTLLCLNLPPHLLAWATSKHLVGITLVSIIYLFYNFRINQEEIK